MAYTRVNWKDSPDSTTPLSAENLNNMDVAIANLDSTMTQVRSEANGARLYAENADKLATENQGRLDNLDVTIEQLEGQVEKCPTHTDYEDSLLIDWNTRIVNAPTIVHFYQIGAMMFVHLVFRTVKGADPTDEYTIGQLAQAFLPKHHHSFACAAINTDTGTITTEGATLKSDGMLQLHLTKGQSASTYLFDLSFFYCVDH